MRLESFNHFAINLAKPDITKPAKATIDYSESFAANRAQSIKDMSRGGGSFPGFKLQERLVYLKFHPEIEVSKDEREKLDKFQDKLTRIMLEHIYDKHGLESLNFWNTLEDFEVMNFLLDKEHFDVFFGEALEQIYNKYDDAGLCFDYDTEFTVDFTSFSAVLSTAYPDKQDKVEANFDKFRGALSKHVIPLTFDSREDLNIAQEKSLDNYFGHFKEFQKNFLASYRDFLLDRILNLKDDPELKKNLDHFTSKAIGRDFSN